MVRSIAIDAKKGNEEKDRMKLHEYPSLSSYPEPQTKHTLKYSLSPLRSRIDSPVLIEPKIQHRFKIQPGAWNQEPWSNIHLEPPQRRSMFAYFRYDRAV